MNMPGGKSHFQHRCPKNPRTRGFRGRERLAFGKKTQAGPLKEIFLDKRLLLCDRGFMKNTIDCRYFGFYFWYCTGEPPVG